MECLYCGSVNYRKNGTARGLQRYRCKDCHHYFSEKPRKFSYKDKRRALDMYLNNVGIRKIAYFLGASPTLILRWIRNFGEELSEKLAKTSETIKDNVPDIIEMDEIYTFIQKNSKEPQYGLLIAGNSVVLLGQVLNSVDSFC